MRCCMVLCVQGWPLGPGPWFWGDRHHSAGELPGPADPGPKLTHTAWLSGSAGAGVGAGEIHVSLQAHCRISHLPDVSVHLTEWPSFFPVCDDASLVCWCGFACICVCLCVCVCPGWPPVPTALRPLCLLPRPYQTGGPSVPAAAGLCVAASPPVPPGHGLLWGPAHTAGLRCLCLQLWHLPLQLWPGEVSPPPALHSFKA